MRPGAAHVQRGAGGPRERLRGRARRAGAAAPPTRSPRNGRSITAYGRPPMSRTARGERLVHRHRRVAEPGDPGPVAERLGERRAEDQRDVLDRVVLVDVEVAVAWIARSNRPWWAATRAGGRRSRRPVAIAASGAVEVERDRDRRSRAWSGDRSRGGPRADRSRWSPSGCRHACGPSPRPSAGGGSDQSVVLGAVADREAEVVGERVAGAERARHEAARRGSPSATAPARSGGPKPTSRKFVTDGPTAQPAARRRRRSAASRSASTRVDVRVAGRVVARGPR